jgi:hypothetical protein
MCADTHLANPALSRILEGAGLANPAGIGGGGGHVEAVVCVFCVVLYTTVVPVIFSVSVFYGIRYAQYQYFSVSILGT